MISVDYVSIDSLKAVYKEFTQSEAISEFLVALYQKVKKEFSQDDHPHYLFTPKQVTNIIYNWQFYKDKDLYSFYYESCRSFREKIVNLDK